MTGRKDDGRGNFVSEWFGHRVYPDVRATKASLADQRSEQCPFLSAAVGEARKCVKSAASAGVCSISSASNGPRQDWLVCPYRTVGTGLFDEAADRLFGARPDGRVVVPAVALADPAVKKRYERDLVSGAELIVYFDHKLGGELSVPATERSPEFSFDVTMVRLESHARDIVFKDFGILEVQTMDFHGSYRAAVRNLQEALRMHRDEFPRTLRANRHWMSENIEGPNIANVFKRTFYQMMFKFQLSGQAQCGGCVLALPRSVWDSWKPHLGGPELARLPDGTSELRGRAASGRMDRRSWIVVFDTDAQSPKTPSPLRVVETISTNAAAVASWALEEAPRAAMDSLGSGAGFFEALERRLRTYWPQLRLRR